MFDNQYSSHIFQFKLKMLIKNELLREKMIMEILFQTISTDRAMPDGL